MHTTTTSPAWHRLRYLAAFLFMTGLSTSVLAQQKVLDFEGIAPGTIVTEVDVEVDGVNVTLAVDGVNTKCDDRDAAVVFNSALPGVQDLDLGTPNETFGGPGVGVGGEAGSLYENDEALGNLLIVHRSCIDLQDNDGDGAVKDPNDIIRPSTITFTFSAPVQFCEYTIVDNEDDEVDNVVFYDESDAVIGTATTPNTGNNGVAVVEVNGGACYSGVKKVVFNRQGSRGLDNLVFDLPGGGCTYPKKDYKNVWKHADRWAVDYNSPFPFYPRATWLQVLNVSPRYGNLWVSLAQQYIAAKNNILNGADPEDASKALLRAEYLLDNYSPWHVPFYKKWDFFRAAKVLYKYNEGYIGPGKCDDASDKRWCPRPRKKKKHYWHWRHGKNGEALVMLTDAELDALAAASADEAEAEVEGMATMEKLDLSGAYPNPFASRANIHFTLPEAADVSLRVYDLLGREVATLASGLMTAGTHEVTLDGTNLANGTYIYRLETPQGSLTRSMVLAK